MKIKTLVLVAIVLTGCGENSIAPQSELDQCLRNAIFERCLAHVPPGPVGTKYNDWDEVVSECENVGYYQSKRPPRFIKPECRVSE